MPTMTVQHAPDRRTLVAYCEDVERPWTHVTPGSDRIQLMSDHPIYVARVEGQGFAPYFLDRLGQVVPCDG